MKNILLAIQNRLVAQVPDLRYTDEDWGQLDYFADVPPVKFPLALLNVEHITWTSKGEHTQLGEAAITITVADLRLTGTSANAPQSQKDAAYRIHTLMSNVHLALHGWSPLPPSPTPQPIVSARPLMRVRTTRTRRDDGIYAFSITFATLLHQNFTPGITYIAPVTPVIQPA